MSGLFFNPVAPGFNADPYPHYQRLRELDPVHRSPMGVWFVGAYACVRQILRDERFTVANIPGQLAKKGELLRTHVNGGAEALAGVVANARHWLSFIEPPDHTRLRRLLAKVFQQHMTQDLRAHVRRCAIELIDAVRPRGSMDVIGDFARLLPARVIGHLIGMPAQDIPGLSLLTHDLSRILDPMMSLEQCVCLEAAARGFHARIAAAIAARRIAPDNDLLSALVAAGRLEGATDAELISNITLLFCAGSETTVNLIGNGLLALLCHPEVLEELRAQPGLLPQAVEELLRYDSPLQMTSRVASTPVQITDRSIAAGEQVYLLVGAANRDPAYFSSPDEVQVRRSPNAHLAFAAGPHACLGASLARLEAQEALSALFECLPKFRLTDEPIAWRAHVVLRGLVRLPIAFTASMPARH